MIDSYNKNITSSLLSYFHHTTEANAITINNNASPEISSAAGTVLLGAAACGRVGQSPIAITSVSTTAVGLRISYFGENGRAAPTANWTLKSM
mmetsp:Transcript_2747/g.4160  ORF Transcript_2747/g.4160 Transcript_2747/m.4160 type:complete len:93 (+) Transcript_2747:2-280(+)